jgi:hypothetical protein
MSYGLLTGWSGARKDRSSGAIHPPQKESIMDRRHKIIMTVGILAGALLLGLRAQPAAADVRIQAQFCSPNLCIAVGHTHGRHFKPGIVRTVQRAAVCQSPAPYRQARYDLVSSYDHRVAKHLARLSGVPRKTLLAERAHGWSWQQIARRHDMERRWLRASFELASNDRGRDRRDRDDWDDDRDDDRGRRDGYGR